MIFQPLPLNETLGKILGHNIADQTGRRILRKGKIITESDITLLQTTGRTTIYVAQLEPDDIDENTAAATIAQATSGIHTRLSNAKTGRVNIYSTVHGVVQIDTAALHHVNTCYDVTLATLRHGTVVRPDKMVATLKIIPYGIPRTTVKKASHNPVITVAPLLPKRVALILSGFPSAAPKITRTFKNALEPRITTLGSTLTTVDFVPLEEAQDETILAETIGRRTTENDLLILAGETAIMDRYDITPRAIERAGGRIEAFGAPVDPGNLLLLAYTDSDPSIPIIGTPGCSRSPKENIIDIVLPRLLAGEHLTRHDITLLAHGGLLDDVTERPLPRVKIEIETGDRDT